MKAMYAPKYYALLMVHGLFMIPGLSAWALG
jgi:hypothetical protein